MYARMLICIKGSSWQLGEVVGLRLGPEREIKLYSCLSDESNMQTLNEKVLCRGWSMMSNLNSNIRLMQGLPAEFSCFCHMTVRQ